MTYASWQVSLVAFLPAVILCGYIYYKDRIEREPVGLLALLFAAGAAAYMPCLALCRLLTGGVDKLFAGNISFGPDGAASYSSAAAEFSHAFWVAAMISVVEVSFIWTLLFIITHKNKNFNYLFDGVVYSVFVSLGFAAVESVRYALIDGWDTLLLRSLSSVPCHLFIGIIMGYFYTMWKAYSNAQTYERKLIGEGKVSDAKIPSAAVRLAASIIIPFVMSVAYRLSAGINSKTFSTLFYFAVFMLYGLSFISIDRISTKDNAMEKFSERVVHSVHGELKAEDTPANGGDNK